jgi:hypothetical protein
MIDSIRFEENSLTTIGIKYSRKTKYEIKKQFLPTNYLLSRMATAVET